MRKTIGYSVLISCLVVYFLSSTDTFTKKLTAAKILSHSKFRTDKYRFGDMYGMCFLRSYKKPENEIPVKVVACNHEKGINLYAICDSYLAGFINSKDYYCGVDNIIFAKVNTRESLAVRLDTTQKNILLIELTERNVRPILGDSAYVNRMLHVAEKKNSPSSGLSDNMVEEKFGYPERQLPGPGYTNSIWKSTGDFFSDVLFNQSINTNIQSNVWDISIFTRVKEIKAAINYKLLGIVDKEVSLSEDRQFLFYTRTIDTTYYTTSSFNTVDEVEINQVVSSLNLMYQRAKAMGFKDVYLAIIPNPVSVIDPDYRGLTYNNLVKRIQGAPLLQMPYIDIFPLFSELKNSVYYASDTHWNMYGAQVWLNQFNRELTRQMQKSDSMSIDKN